MNTLVKIRFGSYLYGTLTPSSDVDYKSVFIPYADDILLQRVKQTISNKRLKSNGEKNYAGEIDEECYALHRYLNLLVDGQTVALDMLFAPKWSMVEEPQYEWIELQRNSYRLITRKSAAFVGYCRQQANKYGIKGSRVAAARTALRVLEEAYEQHGSTAKLREIEFRIQTLCEHSDHMQILDIPGATDISGVRRSVRHWEVCNRKMPFTQTIKSAHEIMRRIVDEYGHRALQAESNEGVDWKALSHAVRIGKQAIELLQTGTITFPRPDAKHLLAIKMGAVPYKKVSEEIEDLLEQVELASERSSLPQTAQLNWIDNFIIDVYRKEVQK